MAVTVKHTDKIASILLVLFAGFVYYLTLDFPEGPGVTSPADFPQFIVGLLALFAIFQFGKSLYQDTVQSYEIEWDVTKRVAIVSVLIIGYVAAMPLLGFLIATAVFLAVGMWYSGVRNYRHIVSLSIAIPIALYYIFAQFLRVPFPENPFIPISRLLPSFTIIGVI